MILTSQRTRSQQARYSQTVNTGRRKLQLLVLNTVVNSLGTLVLVHTATFALEPEESLDNSKPGLFEEGFGNFPQVLDMAIPVLTIQIYFGLYLFLCYYYCFLYIHSGLPQLPTFITLTSSVLELFPL